MTAKQRKEAMSQYVEDSLNMDMSPMIDLTFLLLIFFMVSSHLITMEVDRRVNAPTAKHVRVAEDVTGRVVVNVLADGSVWGQGQTELSTTEAIIDYVEHARTTNDQTPGLVTRLHLRADKDVETRAIKKVVDAAGKAGVADIIFGSLSGEN